MTNLAQHAEILDLLEQVEAVSSDLTPNEREMLTHLKTKYEIPGRGDFDDKICLEVLLRNVTIRKGYDLDPKDAAARIIDLPRK